MDKIEPFISPILNAFPEASDACFEKIRAILVERRNFDIGSYKDKCMKRRIAIRVRATLSPSVEVYGDLLQDNEAELDMLLQSLTIHVSQFYRNRPTFATIQQEVIPALFATSNREEQGLAIWSAGCSSGEEPYTLALMIRDGFAEELSRTKVTIVASDVDEKILGIAREARYGPERLVEAPGHIRERYFTRQGDKYCLLPEIREMVTLQRGNLFDIDSYPPSDLIVCRNVLIYFERTEQEKIINGFARALRPGGMLVLGKAEILVGDTRRHFTTISPAERIYRRNG